MFFRCLLAFVLLNVALCHLGAPEPNQLPCPRCNRVGLEVNKDEAVLENVQTQESDNTHCPRCKGAKQPVVAVEEPCGPRCMEAKKLAEKEAQQAAKTQESDNTHCPRCKGVKKTVPVVVQEPVQDASAKNQESDNTHCPRCKGAKKVELAVNVEEPCGPRCMEVKKMAEMEAQQAAKTQESDNTHCPRCKGAKQPVVAVEEPCGPRCMEAKKMAEMEAQQAAKTQESDNTHCPRCKGVKKTVPVV